MVVRGEYKSTITILLGRSKYPQGATGFQRCSTGDYVAVVISTDATADHSCPQSLERGVTMLSGKHCILVDCIMRRPFWIGVLEAQTHGSFETD